MSLPGAKPVIRLSPARLRDLARPSQNAESFDQRPPQESVTSEPAKSERPSPKP
jgi:hypothetical protein